MPGYLDVGGQTLTFHGEAAIDTIMYQSPTVTITLDKQTLSEFLPPSPASSASPPIMPNRITTDAPNIQFNNAQLFGTAISGNIAVGKSSASVFTSPVVPPHPV